MAARVLYRIQADVIVADRAILQAVAGLGDYAPMNPAYSVDTVRQLEAALVSAQQAEDALLRQVAAVREQTTAAAWAFHEAVSGVKVQVEAQYGSDSPALHAVGLKRRSERRRATRRTKAAA